MQVQNVYLLLYKRLTIWFTLDESSSEDECFGSEQLEPIEYEGEEQLAAVTIVEDFDVEDLAENDGLATQKRSLPSVKPDSADLLKPRKTASQKTGISKKKKKRAEFHYSTKSERLQERAKQLAKRKRIEGERPKKRSSLRRVK
jgi:hypothetical protein